MRATSILFKCIYYNIEFLTQQIVLSNHPLSWTTSSYSGLCGSSEGLFFSLIKVRLPEKVVSPSQAQIILWYHNMIKVLHLIFIFWTKMATCLAATFLLCSIMMSPSGYRYKPGSCSKREIYYFVSILASDEFLCLHNKWSSDIIWWVREKKTPIQVMMLAMRSKYLEYVFQVDRNTT